MKTEKVKETTTVVKRFSGHCSFTAKVIKRMVAALGRFRCTSLSHSLGVNDPFIETHFIIHFLCDESERLRSRV